MRQCVCVCVWKPLTGCLTYTGKHSFPFPIITTCYTCCWLHARHCWKETINVISLWSHNPVKQALQLYKLASWVREAHSLLEFWYLQEVALWLEPGRLDARTQVRHPSPSSPTYVKDREPTFPRKSVYILSGYRSCQSFVYAKFSRHKAIVVSSVVYFTALT